MTLHPNVLIVTTDQQRTDSLCCYGSAFMRTPGFDQVAECGTRFERAYCPSAVCTPSRISLLSGQYVSRHGVWNVGVNAGEELVLLPHILGRSGYETCLVGKAHFEAYGASPEASRESVVGYAEGYDDWIGPYFGFDTVQLALGHSVYGLSGHYGAWLLDRLPPDGLEKLKRARRIDTDKEFGGNAYDWDMPTALSNAVWTADTAIDFLRQKRDPDRPFFLFVSFQDPHHPHAVPQDFADRVDPAAVPLPRFNPETLASLPPHVRAAHEGTLKGSEFARRWPVSGQHDGYDYRGISPAAQRLARSYYYSLVQLVDRQLQRLWTCLAELGLDENTLVVVTSDHGELLGDHGLWLKGPFHFEEVVRVPLLMRGPGIARGIVRKDVVSLTDIVPTVLAAAGLPPDQAALDGVSLTKSPVPQSRTVLCETILDWHGMICRSVIGERHKLTHYTDAVHGELFDLDDDPSEQVNLWAVPAAARTRSEMLGRLLDHDSRILASAKERIAYA